MMEKNKAEMKEKERER